MLKVVHSTAKENQFLVSPISYSLFMTPRRRPALPTLTCPKCLQEGVLQGIIYGMPGDDFDFEMYAVGGCLIEENQPDLRCRDCGWSGLRVFLED